MNYLAKQAARSLSRGVAVRPRLPALFEPANNIAPLHDATPLDAPRVEELRAEPPRSIVAERVLRQEVETVRERIERIAPRTEPLVRTEATPVLPASPSPHIEKREEPALPPAQPPIEIEPRAATTTHTIVDERIVRLIERADAAPAPPPITQRVKVPVAVPERILEPPPPPIHPYAPIPVTARPAERTAPAALRAVESAPSIRITIGRVDVRAVTETETPQRSAPAPGAPTLSLDDYLKQREGRSR